MSVEAQARNSRLDPARLKRLAKWSVGTVLTIAVLGFLAAPPLVRHFGQKIASDVLGRQITIQDIDINPFALSVTATGLDIAEADGQPGAFSFRSLYANLEGESIFRGAPVLREIRLEAPRVNFVRVDETHHSWSDVQERLAARPKSEGDKPALFSLNNIQLVDGAVHVEDRLVGVKNEVTDLTIGMPFVSNLPVKVELFIEPVVSALINGRPLQLVGRTRPFANDRDTVLDLKLDGFDFTPYAAYLPFKSAFRLPEGRVSTDLELAFSQAADETPKVALKGSVDFASITLQDANGAPLLGIPTLSLGLADVQPLARKFHLDRLEIGQPTVNVVRLANGRLNFQEILPPPSPDKPAAAAPEAGAAQVTGNPPSAATPATPAPPASQPAAPEPLLFTLDNAKISGATIRVEDRAAGGPDSGGEPFRTEIKDLQFEARNLSTAPDAVAELALDFATDAGEKSSHRDRVRLNPLEVEGRVAAENFLVSRYLPYYGAQLPGGDVRGGRADATVQYKVKMTGDEPHIDLLAEALVLREFELALKGQKQPVAKLARFAANDVKIVPADRAVSVGSVESSGAAFAAVKDKQGKLDVLGLLGESKPDKAAPAAKPARTAKPAKGGKPQSADDGAAKPWVVTVHKLALDDWSARFEDRTQGTPIVLLADAIKLGAEGISTVKGSTTKLDLAARVNKRGSVGVKGVVGMAPLKGDLSLDLKAVDLLPLQPYVVEQLNIAISRGNLGTRGKLAFEQVRDGSFKASFRGDVGVDNFASIDKAHAADFLRWKKLAVTGIDFRLAPLAVAVNEISLNDFYTRLILDEQGRLNLREIRHRDTPEGAQPASAPAAGEAPTTQGPAASGKAEATVAPPSEPPPPISIGKIAIKQGNIEFSDRFIRPNYDANMTGMEGELVGLSSDPSTIAKLDLRGKVDNTAPVTVAGQLNPFRQDRYLDIAASVKDFELTAVSAYSGRYVGYGIQKGKLSADLHYKIEDRKLTATNRVFLDQLTFGDKVDSPTALDLPVQLAVSLLKNGRGEIDLNMPIGGSLDDPEFSVAGIVFKAIINLIGKALTAPFTLLGSMFGGGEELSYIEFAPGRASLDTATTEKVATLARALADRPALKLEITAYADPATDPDGIRRVQMERSVKAAKLKEMVRKGEEAPSLDELTLTLTLTQEEYATWLRKVYRDADFKRPRNAIGLLKDLPVEEMEALILANTKVDDEALRQLALQRGQVVKDKLLEDGKVPAERVFLLSPKVEAASGDKAGEEGAARRTMFSLK